MKNFERYKTLLYEILCETDKEKKRNESMWSNSILDTVVIPEITELLKYAMKGEVYFKYTKKQRMLQSTYYISDTFEAIGKTSLGLMIAKLQSLYNKL
jgi:hypothetical protein